MAREVRAREGWAWELGKNSFEKWRGFTSKVEPLSSMGQTQEMESWLVPSVKPFITVPWRAFGWWGGSNSIAVVQDASRHATGDDLFQAVPANICGHGCVARHIGDSYDRMAVACDR